MKVAGLADIHQNLVALGVGLGELDAPSLDHEQQPGGLALQEHVAAGGEQAPLGGRHESVHLGRAK